MYKKVLLCPKKNLWGEETLKLPNTILAISFKPKFTSTYCGAIENLLSLLAAARVVRAHTQLLHDEDIIL